MQLNQGKSKSFFVLTLTQMLLLELLNWNEKYLFSLNFAKFLCWKCEAYLDSDAHNNDNSFKNDYINMVSAQNLQNIQLSRKNPY